MSEAKSSNDRVSAEIIASLREMAYTTAVKGKLLLELLDEIERLRAALERLSAEFRAADLPYGSAAYREAQEALNGAATGLEQPAEIERLVREAAAWKADSVELQHRLDRAYGSLHQIKYANEDWTHGDFTRVAGDGMRVADETTPVTSMDYGNAQVEMIAKPK